jgi:hypothetical protein
LLRPVDENVETTGGSVSSYREVSFVLKVPKDAEPGYHVIKVKPSPRIPSGQDSGSINIRTVTTITLIFRVPGEAERKVKVLDVTPGNYNGDRLELKMHILNDGTVTTSCKAEKVKIYNSTGDMISSLSSGFEYLKPNELKEVKVYWYNKDNGKGTYPVSIDLNYFTGRDFKETEFTYSGIPTGKAVAPTPGEEKKGPSVLIFIILVAIIIIAYMIYRWS